jgi:FkbM family methyltransferase
MNNRIQSAEPYTSIKISPLQSGDDILEDILSSDTELLPRKIDKPIMLYGAGSLGKMAKNFFNYLHIPYRCVVDRNASRYKTDKDWQEAEIVHPDDVSESDKRNCLLVICIVTVPLIALRDQLRDNGWEDVAFFYDISEFYRDKYPIDNGWFLREIGETEKGHVRKIYSSLADDASRLHYLQFLLWRKSRIELLSENLEIIGENRFFISEVIDVLNENEFFVDCGAHKGFVIEKFLKTVNNRYEAIYAIEPDRDNLEVLKVQLTKLPSTNIIECALSDRGGKENFYQGFDFASKLSERGNGLVDTITLDSLNLQATFIKMHLEGGELNALKGAINTINTSRPIIAITVYHNSDGTWRTPLFVINNIRDYRYYFKLHSWGGTGAVFYAIPRERHK